jgi:4'-phosphopantetheinyl transferase
MPQVNDDKMSLIKIHNCFLNAITWGDFSSCDFLQGNNVDIWGINIPSNSHRVDYFSALLDPEELIRANRYLHLHDRHRFIISRGALRILLGKYLNILPSLVKFEKGENKKPYIKNTPVFYNISHSGDQILLAVSSSEIGIDVELVNPSFEFKEVVNEYFSPDEASFIEEKHAAERFFILWTRKEAFAKATGKGLDNYIKWIPCMDGDQLADSNLVSAFQDIRVTTFIPNEQYIASIATPHSSPAISFRAFNFATPLL